jgi:L-arabinokinase
MAYRLIAADAGLSPHQADARWDGYLANIGAPAFERRYRALLPDTLGGEEFLARHHPPPGAIIEAGAAYPLRAAAALAVETHLRARNAAALLRAATNKGQREADLQLAGELMAQSHWAQRAAGLGDDHADGLIDLIADAGPDSGLFGARAPAPSSGATLVVLARSESEQALRAIAGRYAAQSGEPVALFGGSAPGCSLTGTREL